MHIVYEVVFLTACHMHRTRLRTHTTDTTSQAHGGAVAYCPGSSKCKENASHSGISRAGTIALALAVRCGWRNVAVFTPQIPTQSQVSASSRPFACKGTTPSELG